MEFSEEMNLIFLTATDETKRKGKLHLLLFFAREIRDGPGSIWREHLRSRKGQIMNQNNLAWEPLNNRELLAGLALFLLPLISPILTAKRTVLGSRIDMVDQEDPVENETRQAVRKRMTGNTSGGMTPLKSAIR